VASGVRDLHQDACDEFLCVDPLVFRWLPGVMSALAGVDGELTDARIDAGIHRSLSRLGVERLDLVQFHWWDYEVPGLERLTERLLRAQSDGRIRLLGVANFDTPHVRQIVGSSENVISLQ